MGNICTGVEVKKPSVVFEAATESSIVVSDGENDDSTAKETAKPTLRQRDVARVSISLRELVPPSPPEKKAETPEPISAISKKQPMHKPVSKRASRRSLLFRRSASKKKAQVEAHPKAQASEEFGSEQDSSTLIDAAAAASTTTAAKDEATGTQKETSVEDVKKALNDCLDLIADSPDMQSQLSKFDTAIPSVVRMMIRFEKDESVQEIACAVVRGLCEHHDHNRVLVTREGGLKAVLAALKNHKDSLPVQVNGMAALANLALNKENKVVVRETKGLEVLKTSMEAHKDTVDVQIQACRAIAALSDQSPKNTKAVAALGLIKILLRVMQDFPSNETLQCKACEAVRALTAENDLNRSLLAAAIPLILKTMKAFPSNATLQAACCAALWNLSADHPTNANAIVAGENGKGIRILLSVMKKHSNDPVLQENGCGVMKNLTVSESHAVQVGRSDGIGQIINAMRQHENDKLVQAQGCEALCNLAMVKDLKANILNEGGIRMIVFAMKQLEDTASVQKQACRALKNLALEDDQNKKSIAASGGIGAMLHAMQQHERDLGVQVAALGALYNLVDIHRNRTTIKSNNGVEIIEAAVQNHPKENFIVYKGRSILQRLEEP